MEGIEGRIEVTERRGRSKKLLDHLKERRGYWKLKDEAVARSVCVENWLWERLWTCCKETLRSE
jgi:hypothetical protein